jgi:ketosteroid isomerase-like protein
MEKWKNEILETEKSFCEMAQRRGIARAFEHFAANDAVVMRGDKLIKGKPAIQKFYESARLKQAILNWKPEFVEVSSSGDMAYTYGKYTFTSTDSTGTKKQKKGIFHTVWRRQADGSWKFVWD